MLTLAESCENLSLMCFRWMWLRCEVLGSIRDESDSISKSVTRNIRQNCSIFHAVCSLQNSLVLLHASPKSDLLISQKRIQNHKWISSAINCLSWLLWRIPNPLAVPAQALSFVIAFPSLDKGWWEWSHTPDYFWALLTASSCPLEWAAQDGRTAHHWALTHKELLKGMSSSL